MARMRDDFPCCHIREDGNMIGSEGYTGLPCKLYGQMTTRSRGGGISGLRNECVSISVLEHERTSTDNVVQLFASGSIFIVGAQQRREQRVMVKVVTHDDIVRS